MQPRQRTIEHLQQLYTVVVGLALALAITKLFDENAEMPLRLDVLPYFVAYLVTLVPFYHGALRHLDITYFEDARAKTKPGALMFDWTLLFLESCFLLGLALLLQRPKAFEWALCILLGFDCVWSFIAHLAFAPETKESRAEWKWATINFVTVCVLVLLLAAADAVEANVKTIYSFQWVIVLVIAVARTILDYVWCWAYFYPPRSLGHSNLS